MVDLNALAERYRKGWIRDDQLERYVKLGAITQQQAEEIKWNIA